MRDAKKLIGFLWLNVFYGFVSTDAGTVKFISVLDVQCKFTCQFSGLSLMNEKWFVAWKSDLWFDPKSTKIIYKIIEVNRWVSEYIIL